MSTAAQPSKASKSSDAPQCGCEAAGQAAGRDMKVVICQRDPGFWEYEGTRAQLEAEGVVPPDFEWPSGTESACWETGRFKWWLRRTRPEGLKGPMRLWTSGDWWFLRCSYSDGLDNAAREVRAAARALEETMYRNSPAGQRERAIAWSRYWAAHEDKVFQAFKRSLPGVDSKKRRAGRSAS